MKGILFTQDNIRLIREGKKTQTRRVESSLKEINKTPTAWKSANMVVPPNDRARLESFYGDILIVKPRYLPGELVYVKEAWYLRGYGWPEGTPDSVIAHVAPSIPQIAYKLDDPVPRGTFGYKSPLFMPAWAARSILRIKDVRPERLQSISEEDAIAEGIQAPLTGETAWHEPGPAIYDYMRLWDSINKKPGTRWEDSPWVWVISFSQEARP